MVRIKQISAGVVDWKLIGAAAQTLAAAGASAEGAWREEPACQHWADRQ